MKHTPGPWTIEPTYRRKKAGQFEHNQALLIVGRGAGSVHRIGVIDGPSNLELLGELQANARLIAASTDLLDACREAESNLAPLYSQDHLVLRKLRAAIKLAIGEARA
jgi:hypothetical protein